MGGSRLFTTKSRADTTAPLDAIAGDIGVAGANFRVREPAKAGARASTGRTTSHATVLTFVRIRTGEILEHSPLGEPSVFGSYHHGFPVPVAKDPWHDEGGESGPNP